MVISDFCISPTEYAINLLPPGDTQDIVSYYSTCSGTDPMQEYISGANSALQTMNQTVTALLETAQCQGNQDLIYVQGNLTLSQEYLNQIDYLSECQAYYDQTNDLLHNAVCFQLFTGFYIVWVCQYVISLGVFLLLVVSCIIYQYFGTYWGMEKADLDMMVHHMEAGQRPGRQASSGGQLRTLLFGPEQTASDRGNSVLSPANSYAAPNIDYESGAGSSSSGAGASNVEPATGSPGDSGIDLSPMASPRESGSSVGTTANPLQQAAK
jgi:hypothetical protein